MNHITFFPFPRYNKEVKSSEKELSNQQQETYKKMLTGDDIQAVLYDIPQ
jgi:hypothetical protein